MNSYRTMGSMVFSWDRLYYIAERTLGFESVHLEVQRGQLLVSRFCHFL